MNGTYTPPTVVDYGGLREMTAAVGAQPNCEDGATKTSLCPESPPQ